MKPEDFLDAMNHIDDELISSAAKSRVKKKNKVWMSWIAVAACFCILFVGVLGHFNRLPIINGENFSDSTNPIPDVGQYSQTYADKYNNALSPFVINLAKYPDCVAYPRESDYFQADGSFQTQKYNDEYDAWLNYMSQRRMKIQSADISIGEFSSKTVKNIFSASDGKNTVYSPVNLYIALSMLAETAGGETRAQILDLLGVGTIEDLRKRTKDIWESNYSDDGLKTSILANSVWLNEDIAYNDATLKTLSENYYASSFAGKMGNAEYNKILKDWINEQTGNLLENEASAMEFDERTVLALVSTVYFNASWRDEFFEENTKELTFKGSKGDETIGFIYQRFDDVLYTGNGYSAFALNFNMTGKMWFILPDEGRSPESILQSGAIDSILIGGNPTSREECFVNFRAPKFDISSSLDLNDNLQTLGVTDAFNGEKSDFSPMVKNDVQVYLSKVNHSARVSIDEKGCTAAAFTDMMLSGMGVPDEKREIDFTLNRPFIFVVTSDDKTPLFVGTVNYIN